MWIVLEQVIQMEAAQLTWKLNKVCANELNGRVNGNLAT